MNQSKQVRLFGSRQAMNNDLRFFVDSGFKNGTLNMYERVYKFSDSQNNHTIRWVTIKNNQDLINIAGLEFSHVTFDVTFPHDYVTYCLSRIRTPWITKGESK